MSYAQRLAAVAVTTAADGSATAYSEVCTGKVSTLRYVKTDFADGSTITITSEATGETIWTETGVNASATRAPRQATHSTAGAAALYAGGGAAVNDKIAVANDRLKIVIANGGNVKSGAFHIVLE
jgi:hypothetical protein